MAFERRRIRGKQAVGIFYKFPCSTISTLYYTLTLWHYLYNHNFEVIILEIKRLLQSEKMNAMKLVWSVFLEFEAPDYTVEGINTFRDFINNEDAIKGLEVYGAYEKGNLIVVIATRNEGNHIALFFVHGKYHRL